MRDRSERTRWQPGRALGPDGLHALARGLTPSELHSLLLDTFRTRAEARRRPDLLQQWRADRFVAPSPVDPRSALEADRVLFDSASRFEAIELSPLAPLAACCAVAPGSQDRIVSTTRGTEVVSDPTNVMALECARRLAAEPDAAVWLACSHRCVRAQPFVAGKGFVAHFRLFCLATGGHERADQALSVEALLAHIGVHLDALDRLEREQGFAFGRRTLQLLSAPTRRALADRVVQAVRRAHPALPLEQAPLQSDYYGGLRFRVDVEALDGDSMPLIDGGVFDWLAQLGANRKLSYVASACGTQLALARCRKPTAGAPVGA